MFIYFVAKYLRDLFADLRNSYLIPGVVRLSEKELLSQIQTGCAIELTLYGEINSIDLTQRDDVRKIDLSNMEYICKVFIKDKNELFKLKKKYFF